MRYWVMEKNGVLGMLADPEEDGVRYRMIESVKAGEVFWGTIPYDELKQYVDREIEIDPNTFKVTAIQPND